MNGGVFGFGQNLAGLSFDFDIARFDVACFACLADARAQRRRSPRQIHRGNLWRLRGAALTRIEHDLDETGAIAQIDKNQSTVIPPGIDPAHEHDVFPNMLFSQLTTAMSSLL